MNDRYMVLTWTLALAACGGEAEIGSDVCFGDDIRCETQPSEPQAKGPFDDAPVVAVSPKSLAKLEHARALEPLGEGELFSYELVVDRAGTLWEFGLQLVEPNATPSRGEARLHLRTTSLAGDVQKNVVEPPEELSSDARTDLPLRARNSERGPIVDVVWSPRNCEGSDCVREEMLAFGSDPAISPERKTPNDASTGKLSPYFSAQAKGRWTTYKFYARSIEQRTRSGELIWRQTALENAGYAPSEHAIELLDTGELVFLAYTPEFGATPELWRIGFDGNVEQRIDLDQLGSLARLTLDSQRRAWMAGVGDLGMLVLRHEGGNRLRKWSFRRTQYNELTVFASSADLADTLYVLTESGDLEETDRVPVLCRVRSNDASDCFVLDKPAETMGRPLRQLKATGPGIVYVGDGQRLFRYELPNAS